MNRSQLAFLFLISCAALAPFRANATPPTAAQAKALNPQPLPPGPPPDPDRARTTNNALGAKTGIIIIGGTPAPQPAGATNRKALNPQPLPPAPAPKDRAHPEQKKQ